MVYSGGYRPQAFAWQVSPGYGAPASSSSSASAGGQPRQNQSTGDVYTPSASIQQSGGGYGNIPSTAPSPAPPQAPAVQSSAPVNMPQDPVDIFVIDDYTPERDQPSDTDPNAFFNHGETVSKMLQAGGGNPALGGGIQLHEVNTDRTDEGRAKSIADALDNVAQIAKTDPGKVDVVNISQSAGLRDAESQLVQEKAQALIDMGIPVVFAAGNDGPGTPNTLAPDSALIVQSADGTGNTLAESGPGNLKAFAPDAMDGKSRQTSFATPQVTTLAGQLKTQGFSVAEIQRTLARQQADNGGILGGATPVDDIFSPGTTVLA